MGPWQMLTFLFSCPPGLSFLPLQSVLQWQARQGRYLLGHTPCTKAFCFVLRFPQPCHPLHSESSYPTYWPPCSPNTHTHAHACVHTRTRMRAHAHVRARTHAHARAHTPTPPPTHTHTHDILRLSACGAPVCLKKVQSCSCTSLFIEYLAKSIQGPPFSHMSQVCIQKKVNVTHPLPP